jgi:hypothetical protein
MIPYALFPTLLAVVGYLLDPDALGRDAFPSLRSLLALYVILGLLGGSTLGLLRPYAQGRLRTGLVGVGVALPMTLTLMLFVANWRLGDMDALHFVVAVILALVAGPLGAAYIHWQTRRGWNPP